MDKKELEKLIEEKKKENPTFPFTYIDGQRQATLEDMELFSLYKKDIVEKVIKNYNDSPKNKNRQAIRGGERKPRCPDEQRVLDSFTLK